MGGGGASRPGSPMPVPRWGPWPSMASQCPRRPVTNIPGHLRPRGSGMQRGHGASRTSGHRQLWVQQRGGLLERTSGGDCRDRHWGPAARVPHHRSGR